MRRDTQHLAWALVTDTTPEYPGKPRKTPETPGNPRSTPEYAMVREGFVPMLNTWPLRTSDSGGYSQYSH
jgi:hypothetical protein